MLRRRGLLLAADRIGYALQANWIDTVWSIRGGCSCLLHPDRIELDPPITPDEEALLKAVLALPQPPEFP